MFGVGSRPAIVKLEHLSGIGEHMECWIDPWFVSKSWVRRRQERGREGEER